MGSIQPGTRSKVPDDVRRVFEEYDIDNGKLPNLSHFNLEFGRSFDPSHDLLTFKDGYWGANETELYIATEFDGCDWGSELISIFMKVSIFLLIGLVILVLSCIVICCQKLCKK